MLPYLREEIPHKFLARSWPSEFRTRRTMFNRESENLPYVDLIKGITDGSYEDDCDSDSSDEEDGSLNNLIEHVDYTNVRRFMEEFGNRHELPRYHDQVEQVARFCEQAGFNACETRNTYKKEKNVALLDERANIDTDAMIQGHCRPYLGPLTAQQLMEALGRKVPGHLCSMLRLGETDTVQRLTNKSRQDEVFGEDEVDAERRLM